MGVGTCHSQGPPVTTASWTKLPLAFWLVTRLLKLKNIAFWIARIDNQKWPLR